MPMGVYERKPWHKTFARRDLYVKVVRARKEGMPIRAIAALFGVSCGFVGTVLRNPENPEWNRSRDRKRDQNA